MPSVSGRQHRAMEAAAHGHSTIGIPSKVGKDFAAADAHHAPGSNHHPDHGKSIPHKQETKHDSTVSSPEYVPPHGGFGGHP